MSLYSLLGVGVIILASVTSLCALSKYSQKRLNEYKELLAFLYSVKNKISANATKISHILTSIDKSEYKDIKEFIKKAESIGIYRAFLDESGGYLINDTDKKALDSCFYNIGANMLLAELQNIDNCIKVLEKSYDSLKEKAPSELKIKNTVIICLTLLILILIV